MNKPNIIEYFEKYKDNSAGQMYMKALRVWMKKNGLKMKTTVAKKATTESDAI